MPTESTTVTRACVPSSLSTLMRVALESSVCCPQRSVLRARLLPKARRVFCSSRSSAISTPSDSRTVSIRNLGARPVLLPLELLHDVLLIEEIVVKKRQDPARPGTSQIFRSQVLSHKEGLPD